MIDFNHDLSFFIFKFRPKSFPTLKKSRLKRGRYSDCHKRMGRGRALAPINSDFYNFIGQSLKFGQTLFDVFTLYGQFTIKSISQSISVICNHKMPDFSTKTHQIQFRLGFRLRHSSGDYNAPPDS